MSEKIWFITGASRGFGRIWAEDALKRGDKVVATARSVADVTSLADVFGDAVLPLALDVTNRAQVAEVVATAHAHFGRLDIVLNNAGYALVGAIEEANEAEVRAEFDTNVFGPLTVIQAALPLLRAQQGGHIIGVSSVAGFMPPQSPASITRPNGRSKRSMKAFRRKSRSSASRSHSWNLARTQLTFRASPR